MGMFVQINTNYQSSGLRIMAYCQCHIVENSTTNDKVCMGGKCRQWTISSKTNTHLDVYRYCCIHSLHMQMQVHMQLVIRGIYNFLKGDNCWIHSQKVCGDYTFFSMHNKYSEIFHTA